MRQWWGVALLVLAACGAGDLPATSDAATTSTAAATSVHAVTTSKPAATIAAPTTTASECQPVGTAFLKTLNVRSAAFVRRAVARSATGLLRQGAVWFVSTPGGATWVTNAGPTKDEAGLILPLNQAARATAEVGVDVSVGSPAYAGITDIHEGAVASRRCAG